MTTSNSKSNYFYLILSILFLSSILLLVTKVHADSKSAHKYYKQMVEYRQRKQYKNALYYAKKAEAADPKNGWYSAILAHLYQWNLNRPDSARSAYQRALTKKYSEPWMYRNMAQLSWANQKNDQAEKEIQTAIQLANSRLLALENQKKSQKQIKIAARDLISGYGLLAKNQIDLGDFKNGMETANRGYDLVKKYQVRELGNLDYYLVYARVLGNYWLGHISAAEQEFIEAANHYQAAINHLNDNPKMINWSKEWEIHQLLSTMKKRQQLGHIDPEYIHKIHAMYIQNVDVKFKSQTGKTISAKNSLTKLQIKKSKIFQGVLKAWVETWSGGKMGLKYSHKEMDRTIHDIKVSKSGSIESRQPRIESIKPELGSYLYEKSNEYDTFIYYWNAEGFATTANGGSQLYPFVTYQLNGALRGYMSMPTNWVKLPSGFNTLLHEFFHTIESMSGIKPMHGFQKQNRHFFPGWKGKGQLSYFRWQFENTLPRVTNDKNIKIQGWKNFNFLERYPETISEDILLVNREAARQVSIQNRIKAEKIYQKAREHRFKNQIERQVPYYKKALQANKNHIGSNRELAIYYSRKKNYQQSARHYQRFLKFKPVIWGFNNLAWLYQWKLKNPGEAVEYLNQAILLDKTGRKTLGTRQNLGRALIDTGKYEASLDAFQECRDYSNKFKVKNRYMQCTFWKGYTYGEKLSNRQQARILISEAWQGGFQSDYSRFYYKKYVTSITASRSMGLATNSPSMPVSKKPALGKKQNSFQVYD